jgi:hypothetical protein
VPPLSPAPSCWSSGAGAALVPELDGYGGRAGDHAREDGRPGCHPAPRSSPPGGMRNQIKIPTEVPPNRAIQIHIISSRKKICRASESRRFGVVGEVFYKFQAESFIGDGGRPGRRWTVGNRGNSGVFFLTNICQPLARPQLCILPPLQTAPRVDALPPPSAWPHRWPPPAPPHEVIDGPEKGTCKAVTQSKMRISGTT